MQHTSTVTLSHNIDTCMLYCQIYANKSCCSCQITLFHIKTSDS